jgi:FkbM family methyltransferase
LSRSRSHLLQAASTTVGRRSPATHHWLRTRLASVRATTHPGGWGYHVLNEVNTLEVLNRVVKPNSWCVDVGASVGDVTAWMVHLAPTQRHLAIEPIPSNVVTLKQRFGGRIEVCAGCASSDAGSTSFQVHRTNSGYSGMRKTEVAISQIGDDFEQIDVPTYRLDDLVGDRVPAVIKIDVEGAEALVIAGASKTLGRHKPTLIMEAGKHSSVYDSSPADLAESLRDSGGYRLYGLADWLRGARPMSTQYFAEAVAEEHHAYFVAVAD